MPLTKGPGCAKLVKLVGTPVEHWPRTVLLVIVSVPVPVADNAAVVAKKPYSRTVAATPSSQLDEMEIGPEAVFTAPCASPKLTVEGLTETLIVLRVAFPAVAEALGPSRTTWAATLLQVVARLRSKIPMQRRAERFKGETPEGLSRLPL